MTNAINTFYIFVSRQYQGNSENLVSEIDSCGDSDGVITYNEFDTFVRSTSLGFDTSEILQVFNTLDRKILGKVQGTTVSEHMALNQSEQATMVSKIQAYGAIYDVLDAQYNVVKPFVDNYHPTYAGLSKESVKQKALELILASDDYNLSNAQSIEPDDAKVFLKQGAATVLKDCICDTQSWVNGHLSSDYPGLKDDPDLNALITSYLNTFDATQFPNQGHDVNDTIMKIIKTYIFQAGLISDPGYDGEYQYADNAKMTTIQISKLAHRYEHILNQAMNNGDLDIYEHFGANISNLIAQYIEEKEAEWATMTVGDFSNIFNATFSLDSNNNFVYNVADIIEDFKNSDALKTIVKMSEIIAIDDDLSVDAYFYINNSGTSLNVYNPNWSDGWMHLVDVDENGHYLATGANGENLHVIVNNDGSYSPVGDNNVAYNGNYTFVMNDASELFRMLYFNLGFGGLQNQACNNENGDQIGWKSTLFTKLFTSGRYNKYVTQAWSAIQANPSAYHIDDLTNCSKGRLQKAIVQYMVQHLSTILKDCGFDDKEVTLGTLSGVASFCNSVDNNWNYSNLKDAKEAVRNAINSLKQTYAGNSDILAIINDPQYGLDSDETINSYNDAGELCNRLKSLRNALKHSGIDLNVTHVDPPEDPNIEEPTDPDVVNNWHVADGELQNIFGTYQWDYGNQNGSTNLLMPGEQYGLRVWSTAKSTAYTNFQKMVNRLGQKAAAAGIASDIINSAKTVLNSYFLTVLDSYDSLLTGGNLPDSYGGGDDHLTYYEMTDAAFRYTANGQSYTLSGNSRYACAWKAVKVDSVSEISGKTSESGSLGSYRSASGIYVGVDINDGGADKDQYYIGVDYQQMFVIFKEILKNFCTGS